MIITMAQTVPLSVSVSSASYLVAALGVAFFLVLLCYSYLALRELRLIFGNYGVPRAEFCRWSSCGLFAQPHSTGGRNRCFSPFVSDHSFRRRERGGLRRGCRFSVTLSDDPNARADASL